MQKNTIIIKGAKENNLKNVSLEIPKNKLIVFTGLSGSGKSSLAFNTIYEEGRRRYIDSLSSYARQFLGGVKKPNVESIEGLSPAISIEQKTTHNNPRSTVGTITEIYDYLRILFSRTGDPYCPKHNKKIYSQTIEDIIKNVFKFKENSKLIFLSPIIKEEKGSHEKILERLKREGFVRLKINNDIVSLDNNIILERTKKHSISIVVDRIVLNEENKNRISEAINIALQYSKGLLEIENFEDKTIHNFSQKYSCSENDFEMIKIEPRLFSFNTPFGMCNTCKGLGVILKPDFNLIVKDENISINNGAISFPGFNIDNSENLEWKEFEILLNHYKINKDIPIKELSEAQLKIIKFGSKEEIEFQITSKNGNTSKRLRKIEGVLDKLERKFLGTSSEEIRTIYRKYMSEITCNSCKGARLNNYALAVKIDDLNIYEFTKLSIEDALERTKKIFDNFTDEKKEISLLVINEIKHRLTFLVNVGLEYISLNRTSETLSGGESQRIRLATQIGSKLTGVLYVLDEPSIGLHQSDNKKLLNSLREMVNIGNTLIVVEHDEETILEADFIVDIGPKAGEYGGEVIAIGSVKQIIDSPNSITGQYLSRKENIPIPTKRRNGNGKFIEIIGANENNLKNVNVKIPLGILVSVTGVSGSGKSTLINEILIKGIEQKISNAHVKPGLHSEIKGIEHIDKIIKVSQSPIGRTPRSNPATYTGVFDDIREVFSLLELSRARGYTKGRFSFNVKGGRCNNCSGDGTIKIEMHFLPDVYIKCNMCDGKRYNFETLEVKYRDKNIADILDMSIDKAYDFFSMQGKIQEKLKIIIDVGLGYIKLGQEATTLSGGEAQRVKLATYLQKKPTGKTLFILDEPTTGLHSYDVNNLIKILNRIVDKGDSVIVIEHNLDVIKVSDYIIDLGPGGGEKGGKIIFQGKTNEIVKIEKSLTGVFLKNILN
ncbi:MAG: excinuclease ABC subunit UvrA [Metamycoplasmataceae bacterium]